MPGSKSKTGKDRLDKYYHLAKDQGYRARSAFKLIQLAKKFDFLSKSKVCLDLCAAPGGWSQVAQRNMPHGAQILALDLAPIKAIHGVTCIQTDITTDKCRQILRKEMNDKADCVLHDGAPNVGASWARDAYGQNELTLHALKLSCEHLKVGGTFVTKVFRSSDYNSLLWVFGQLFHKVDATKPTASRNVSAEIFVMCINYKGGKIDPRFFDPKWVFMETCDPLGDDGEVLAVKKPGASLNDYIKNLQKRHRGGYEVGDDMKILQAHEFIASRTPAELLITHHVVSFQGPANEEISKDPLTTEEIRELGKDLKVLGKKDLSTLLKWRMKVMRDKERVEREAKKEMEKVALATKPKSAKEMVGATEEQLAKLAKKGKKGKTAKEGIAQDVDDAISGFLDGDKDENDEEGSDSDEGSEEEDSEGAEEKINEELEDLVTKRRREERIEAKKTANRQKKQEWRKKLSLGTSQKTQDEPELLRASNMSSIKALEDQDDYIDPNASSNDEEEDDDADQESDSDEEELDRYARLEVDLAVSHELSKAHDGEKFRKKMQRKMKAKKESRRERVMAAWAGELGAFNEALDQKASTHHMLENQKEMDDDEEDSGDDDSDDEADLKTLRLSQHAAFSGVDMDSMESSMAGPGPSAAAREIMAEGAAKKKVQKAKMDQQAALKDGEEVDLDQMTTDLAVVEDAEDQVETLREKHRANRWFSQDIFKNVGAANVSDIMPLDHDSDDAEEDGIMQEADDKDLPQMPLTDKEKRKLKRKKDMEKLERLGIKKPRATDTAEMEVAPLEAPVQLDMTGPQKPTDPRELAETMALGTLLTSNKKTRMDLIDASYNRWTFDGDEALPDWFTEDENKHNKPELPITKEMMATWRAKLREINARPIRKVAEAKARKKRRLKMRLDKLRKTAMSLVDAPDMSESAKARLMRKQVSKAANADQRQVTTVGIQKSGGGNRGKKEKGKVSKGAKVKVVDHRLKSDARSEKRAAKRAGAKGRAKNRKTMLKKQRKKEGKGGGLKNSGGKHA